MEIIPYLRNVATRNSIYNQEYTLSRYIHLFSNKTQNTYTYGCMYVVVKHFPEQLHLILQLMLPNRNQFHTFKYQMPFQTRGKDAEWQSGRSNLHMKSSSSRGGQG